MNRIGFIIFLVIGNITVGILTYYFLGKDITIELIAIFTSLSTAAYAILNEPEKPQPLLRVKPNIRAGYGMGSLGFDLSIDNIGDASAKDVKLICKTDSKALTLEKGGVYTIKVLPPKDIPELIMVVSSVDTQSLASQKIDVEVKYSNMNDKQQQIIKESYEIKELLDKHEKDSLLE